MFDTIYNYIKSYIFQNKHEFNKEAYDECVKTINLLPKFFSNILSIAHIDVKQVDKNGEINYVLFNIDKNKEWYYFSCQWAHLSENSYYKWYFQLLRLLDEELKFKNDLKMKNI